MASVIPSSNTGQDYRDLFDADPKIAESIAAKLSTIRPALPGDDKGGREDDKQALMHLVKNHLIDESMVQRSASKGIPYLYAECIVRAISESSLPKLGVLKTSKIFTKVLVTQVDVFDQNAVQILIREGAITAASIEELSKNERLKKLLLDAFDESLKKDDGRSLAILKSSGIPQESIKKALNDCNEDTIWNLFRHNYLKSEHFARDKKTQLVAVLEKILQRACQDTSSHGTVCILVKAGIRPKPKDLYKLILEGRNVLVKTLVEENIAIEEAIFELIANKQSGRLRMLMEDGTVAPDLRNSQGYTLLWKAVTEDHFESVEVLMQAGANPLLELPGYVDIFHLAKGKQLRILNVLHFPERLTTRYSRSTRWTDAEFADEEKALEKMLLRRCAGNKAADYFCLFIKTETVALAVLKSTPFPSSSGIAKSYQHSFVQKKKNRVHCWSRKDPCPVPNHWIPRQESMLTTSFGIRLLAKDEKESADEEGIECEGKKFAFKLLPNTFKTDKLATDCGFKYSHGDISLHGHGPNPQAALSAFNQRKESLMRLSKWKTAPDVTVECKTLTALLNQLQELAKQDAAHKEGLQTLNEGIASYLTSIGSILQCRSSSTVSQQQVFQEERLIEKTHGELTTQITKARQHIYSSQRLNNWTLTIEQQMATLQQLQQKLTEAAAMNSQHSAQEGDEALAKLSELKDLVVSRTVTSSELPTVKIYSESTVVENIFTCGQNDIRILKKLICQTIASFLGELPSARKGLEKPPMELRNRFNQPDYRKKVAAQLVREAQFIGNTILDENPFRIQELAAHRALFLETLQTLEALPPVRIDSQAGVRADSIVEPFFQVHISHYLKARSLLNELWLEACFTESTLNQHLEEMLDLLSRRVLIMDEEIQGEEKKPLVYPAFDDRDPRKALNLQLFLLQTSLLIALRNASEKERKSMHAYPATVQLVKLRLQHAVYGIEKKQEKIYRFFIDELAATLIKVQAMVKETEELPDALKSKFKPLYLLLKTVPDKKELTKILPAAFEGLSDTSALMLSQSLEEFISLAQKIKAELQHLLQLQLPEKDAKEHVNNLKHHLDLAAAVLKNEAPSEVDIASLKLVLKSPTFSTDQMLEKLEKFGTQDLKTRIEKLLADLDGVKDLNLSQDKARKFLNDIAKLHKLVCDRLVGEISRIKVIPDFQKCLSLLQRLEQVSNGSLKEIKELVALSEKLARQEKVKLDSELKKVVEQIDLFLGSHKRKKIPEEVRGLMEELRKLTDEILREEFSSYLTSIKEEIEFCQEIISNVILKKLQQMSSQVQLGIRQQTFYTTTGDNLTYYSWEGDPFDACLYHSFNVTHLPLESSMEWENQQRSLGIRKMLGT